MRLGHACRKVAANDTPAKSKRPAVVVQSYKGQNRRLIAFGANGSSAPSFLLRLMKFSVLEVVPKSLYSRIPRRSK